MDPRKCIAYLSYFTEGEIPAPIRSKMGAWIYGCDRCQEACPKNRKWMEKSKPVDESLAARAGDFQLETLLLMSQEHYEKKVWPLVYYIRKENRKLWQRNAAVALGNLGDPEKTPALIKALEDPEPIVRAHVAWALGKLSGPSAKAALEKARKTEEGVKVREEIEEALKGS
jgi:epoxyqueuosine reductase